MEQQTFSFPDLDKRAAKRAERIRKNPKFSMSLVPDETLREAREQFSTFLFEGKDTRCPCCGRKARIYKRKLNSGMARMIVRFYEVHFRLPDQEWIHVHDLFGGFAQAHRDWPVLRLWGLIERKGRREKSEASSGLWKLTPEGRAFARGEGTAPKYVLMFDKRRIDVSDARITIGEALGDAFDYEELMQPYNTSPPVTTPTATR